MKLPPVNTEASFKTQYLHSQSESGNLPLSSQILNWLRLHSSTMSNSACTICNKPATKCSTCLSAACCSIACQKADWPVHKTLCKSFANNPPRPSQSHKLGFLFPPKSKYPKLIWIEHLQDSLDDHQGHFTRPQIDPFLSYGPRDFFTVERVLIEKDRIERATCIDHTLTVYMRELWC